MSRAFLIAMAAILIATDARAARPSITIEGVFVTANGRGIPNARVELEQRNWGFPLEVASTPLANTTTDKSGRFRFTGPWRGRFIISCFSRHNGEMGSRDVRGSERDIRIYPFVFQKSISR